MSIRIRTFLVLTGVLMCSPGYSQTMSDEFATLRDHLNLPADTPVRIREKPALSFGPPFRVYLAADKQPDLERDFAGWVEGWNKKHAQELRIERVKFDDAEIIISPCRPSDSRTSIPLVAQRRLGGPGLPNGLVSHCGHIVERKPDGLEIVERVDSTGPFDQPGKDIWDKLVRLMKQRCKAAGKP